MTVAEILSKAADLIEPEGAWTQHEWARGPKGEEDPIGPAACWCAWGAIYEVCGRGWPPASYDAIQEVQGLIDADLREWNDRPERTQAEVVAKLREAAALATQSDPLPINRGVK